MAFKMKGFSAFTQKEKKENPYIKHIVKGGTPPSKPDSLWNDAVKTVYDNEGNMKSKYVELMKKEKENKPQPRIIIN